MRQLGESGLRIMEKSFVWVLALGLLLPTMHQSSLGTMMLLPGPKVHPLWFTPWLPLLFLVNCIIIGFAIVTIEATFSAVVFGRKRETVMLASLSRITGWVAIGWLGFRFAEVALAGELGLLGSGYGIAFLAEIFTLFAGAAILLSGRRHVATWQVRGAVLLLLGGALHRINTYLVAFRPGSHFSYFPALPELLITFGIIAAEVAIYVAVVKTFPILSGHVPAKSEA
jgi:Ni/Fe-hydrogenase subunit HybB-like protein